MKLNETREANVDVGHVLEETVNATSKTGLELLVFEGISNALDAQADQISITLDDDKLIIRDNGPGISKEDFDEVFDIGIRKKDQQIGIGHLGQGMKSGLLETKKARLSTKSKKFAGSCQFYTKRDDKSVEIKRDDNDPFLEQATTGTKLSYSLPRKLKKRITPKRIVSVIEKWFPTLLDNSFLEFYRNNGFKDRERLYPNSVRFYINGKLVPRRDVFKNLPVEKETEGNILRNYGHGEQVIGHYKLGKAKEEVEQYGIHRIVCGIKINKSSKLGHYALANKRKIIGYVEYTPLVTDLRSNKESFDKSGMHYLSYFPKDFSNTIYKNFLRKEDLLRGVQSDDDLENTWKKFSRVFPERLELPFGLKGEGPSKAKGTDRKEKISKKQEKSVAESQLASKGGARPKIQFINDPQSPIAMVERFPDDTPYIAINKAHDMREIDPSELQDLIGILYASIDYSLNNGLRDDPDYILEAFDNGLKKYARE